MGKSTISMAIFNSKLLVYQRVLEAWKVLTLENRLWLVVEPHPEKYEFASWDDDIPYIMKKKLFQTTNQIWVCLKIGYIPNEIAIFHRDNDQQNHWV